jgi:hypothetical protein
MTTNSPWLQIQALLHEAQVNIRQAMALSEELRAAAVRDAAVPLLSTLTPAAPGEPALIYARLTLDRLQDRADAYGLPRTHLTRHLNLCGVVHTLTAICGKRKAHCFSVYAGWLAAWLGEDILVPAEVAQPTARQRAAYITKHKAVGQ